MTDESASLTEPWIAKHEASYPYAYDKGGKLKRWFGVSGIPHAVLVDATGTVVWRGHPATLRESEIEEHLAGTLAKPLYEWPSAAKGVAKKLTKGDLAGALEDARALSEGDDGPAIATQIQGLIDGRVKQVEGWLAAGNYLDVVDAGADLAKGLKGHEAQAVVEGFVAQVDAKDDAKDVIDAQKRIRKLRSKDPSKRKDIERQMEDLEKIRDDMRGTYAAEEASAYLDQLREKLMR